jgi:hypothetical protein
LKENTPNPSLPEGSVLSTSSMNLSHSISRPNPKANGRYKAAGAYKGTAEKKISSETSLYHQ